MAKQNPASLSTDLSVGDGGSLVVEVLLRRVPEDECGEFVPHVHGEVVAACLARGGDNLLDGLDLQHRLRVVTLLAQDKPAKIRLV